MNQFKYNLGESVYFLYDGKIYNKKIKARTLKETILGEVIIDYVVDPPNTETYSVKINEKNIFSTIEEVYKNIPIVEEKTPF